MKKYSIFHPFILSFFSKDLYRDVAHNWGGSIVAYLLLLLLVTWLPVTIFMHQGYKHFVNTSGQQIVQQVPTITIKNGEVSIDKPVPYIINKPNSQDPFIIIDTSGKYTSLKQTTADFLITKNQVLMRQNQDETQEYTFHATDNYVITQELVGKMLDFSKHWGVAILYFVLVFVSFIYRLIQTVIYAVIGLVFKTITNAPLTFGQIWKIAVIAITPAVILDTFLTMLITGFPYQSFFYFILTMVYLFFGVKANSLENKAPTTVTPP